MTGSTRIAVPDDLRLTAGSSFAARWSRNVTMIGRSTPAISMESRHRTAYGGGDADLRRPPCDALARAAAKPDERLENAEYSPAQRLDMIEVTAWMLAAIADGSPPEAIGFHPSGMTDREGYLAMGCSEMLTHGFDIASALRRSLRSPRDLAARVTARLFPGPRSTGIPGTDALVSRPHRPSQPPPPGGR